MEAVFEKPYPARAAVGVLSLPRNVSIEAEAIMIIENWSMLFFWYSREFGAQGSRGFNILYTKY